MKKVALLLFLLPSLVSAQGGLSLQQAIETALKNNYAITIARNSSQIGSNNNTAGNAGMLPSLDITASDNVSVNDIRQQFFNGEIRERNNARANNLSTGIALNWTVFDGFAMFAEKQKLTELEAQGEQQARLTIGNTVAEVIRVYTDLIQQQQKLEALKEVMSISSERKFLAREKYTIGSGSELEFLQASVDLNEDSSAILRQHILIRQARADLSRLLALDSLPGNLSDREIQINETLELQPVLERITSLNPELSIAERNIAVSRLTLRQIKSARLPRISVNTGYAYSRQEAQAGLLQSSRSQGFNYGISASLSLFDGLENRRNARNAKLELNNYELEKKDTELRLRTEASTVFSEYRNSLSLIGIEKQNADIAKKNADVSLEKYKLGSISAIELRDAQQSFLDARIRLLNELYIARTAETELLRLSGQLLK
jgi:outer membrane protein